MLQHYGFDNTLNFRHQSLDLSDAEQTHKKTNVIYGLQVRVVEVLSMGLSDQYGSILERFFLSLMIEELILSYKDNS